MLIFFDINILQEESRKKGKSIKNQNTVNIVITTY